MPRCRFLHVSCAWVSLSFYYVQVCSFYQIWENFGHYFFKSLFSPGLLWELQLPILKPHEVAPQCADICSFFSISSSDSLVSLCFILDSIIMLSSSSLISSAISDLLLINLIFHLTTCSFHLQKFDLGLFIYSIPLPNLKHREHSYNNCFNTLAWQFYICVSSGFILIDFVSSSLWRNYLYAD